MITLTREEAQQVLDVIQRNIVGVPRYKANELLRARLAQPELSVEPVARVPAHAEDGIEWLKPIPSWGTTLYTAPPQRKWQSLTEEEVKLAVMKSAYTFKPEDIARNVEEILKGKNYEL